ncbi:MAG: carbon storage regulator [Planctomycetota bacterium]|nr:MAG: carbon storage regulator [Planctomycetota bacterium]
MLVLSRKEGQGITIGPNIRLVVIAVRGKAVRIGIEAPPDVRVLREELTETPSPNAPNQDGPQAEPIAPGAAEPGESESPAASSADAGTPRACDDQVIFFTIPACSEDRAASSR